MKRFITTMVLTMIAPLIAFGQWDMNVWPAYEHPRSGKTHATNCVAAFNERNVISSDDFKPMSTPLFRTQRSYAVDLKNRMRGMLTGYWDEGSHYMRPWTVAVTSSYSSAANESTVVLPDLDGGARVLPVYSLSNIFQAVSLPTNFFDYTPWRGLDGLGTFTNDTTVGHPYGWTNEYTVAGGTNFPAGRTNWYTTDYGWDGIKAVLNKFVIFEYQQYAELGVGTSNATWWSGQQSSWDDAITACEAYTTPYYDPRTGHRTEGVANTNNPVYWAYAYGWDIWMNVPWAFFPFETNYMSATTIFLTWKPDLEVGMGEYDPQGSSFINQGAWATNELAYGWQELSTPITTNYLIAARSFPAEWCGDPVTTGNSEGDGYYYSGKGWSVREYGSSGYGITTHTFFDLSGTNGFKYK